MAEDGALELAKVGQNPTCIDCGAESMGGGLRCQACFEVHIGPPKPTPSSRPDPVGRIRQVRLPAAASDFRPMEAS